MKYQHKLYDKHKVLTTEYLLLKMLETDITHQSFKTSADKINRLNIKEKLTNLSAKVKNKKLSIQRLNGIAINCRKKSARKSIEGLDRLILNNFNTLYKTIEIDWKYEETKEKFRKQETQDFIRRSKSIKQGIRARNARLQEIQKKQKENLKKILDYATNDLLKHSDASREEVVEFIHKFFEYETQDNKVKFLEKYKAMMLSENVA